MISTVASSKGGPGKSTVTMLLAAFLAAEGHTIVVLDADPTLNLRLHMATVVALAKRGREAGLP